MARTKEFLPRHFCFEMFLLLLLLLLFASATRGQGQTVDDLFSNSALQDIQLTMLPSDWETLKEHYLQDDYYKASFTWNGITLDEVGVRSRGSASRSGVKPYLGLDFKRYRSTQRFLGLAGLRLKNMIQDGSLMHERLSMLMFRRMNLAAPREGYARVYMNGDYIGLYIMIEEIDANFLQNAFGDANGFLLEYVRLDEWHLEDLGDDPALYVPARFDVKTRKTEFNAASIAEMVAAVNHSSDEEFPANVGRYLDLRNVLRYVAVENFLAEWDGFLGHGGMNNYYLYQVDALQPFQLIAWDKEQGFGDPEYPIFERAELNVLIRRALENAELRDYYLTALRRAALEAGGSDGWLLELANNFYGQIWLAVLEDPKKLTSNAEFESGIMQIRSNIPLRYNYLIGELGGQRAPALTSVVNSASYYAPPVAAGGIATIFGSDLAFTSTGAGGAQLPTMLSSTTVILNGAPAPLLYASPGRVDFQVPWELASAEAAELRVAVGGVATESFTLRLAAAASGVFSYYRTGSGQGAVVNSLTGQLAAAHGSIPGVATEAVRAGDYITIYATGLGEVWPAPASGAAASGSALSRMVTPPVVSIGGATAAVSFAGLAPGLVGIYQINTVVPEQAPVGEAVPVVIEAGASVSNKVFIGVR